MSHYRFTHGSLFSGIGGFDLAAEWMGWDNIFHCEWNTFGQKVLKHYWPNAISYEDITSTDFTIHRGRIDILTGGFPCQPYSAAGKRLGKEDDRHLWPEMLRAIREIQPMYVVGENVRGLTNWNGGMVFDEVQADLENQGYEVLPFLLPACGVNAPHRRDRIWFIAYTNNERNTTRFGCIQKTNGKVPQWNNDAKFSNASDGFAANPHSNGHKPGRPDQNRPTARTCETNEQERERVWNDSRGISQSGIIADAKNTGQQTRTIRQGKEQFGRGNITVGPRQWDRFPTQSPVCNGNDGLSTRLDGITFPKWRNESIKAGGNAIVPQVAYQIFKALSL